MKVTKEVTKAAMLAWNEISEQLDAKPNTFSSLKEFEAFYKKLLDTLLEEEIQQ